MKKRIRLITVILIFITLKSFGQKLEENHADDFTHDIIKRTSWESLCSSFTANAHFRISSINGSKTFDLRLMLDMHFFIDGGSTIMFKLGNGNVVTLKNLDYAKTCKGCGAVGLKGSGAPGIEVSYQLGGDEINQLEADKIVKVRIYTSNGYVDEDIKNKNSDKIEKALSLVN
jgi:hypothetical protein